VTIVGIRVVVEQTVLAYIREEVFIHLDVQYIAISIAIAVQRCLIVLKKGLLRLR